MTEQILAPIELNDDELLAVSGGWSPLALRRSSAKAPLSCRTVGSSASAVAAPHRFPVISRSPKPSAPRSRKRPPTRTTAASLPLSRQG